MQWVLPLMLVGSIATAAAHDANADFLARLFDIACLSHLGNPEATRAWAVDHHLSAITDPASFKVFAGPGALPPVQGESAGLGSAIVTDPAGSTDSLDPGIQPGAWSVPGPGTQGYVLSLRGAIGACAVWARQADPGEVMAAFLKGVAHPSDPALAVRKVAEKRSSTPFGMLSMVLYLIESQQHGSFLFTVLTSERPGGVFQASLQVAPVAGR